MMPTRYQSPKANSRPMSDDEIRRYAPSVFAEQPNGGSHYRKANGDRGTVREVGSVQEKVRINKSLWKLTAHMAELHGVAMPQSEVIEGEVVA
jgi:hypothetical protein